MTGASATSLRVVAEVSGGYDRDLDEREAQLSEREAAIYERERALRDLEEAMGMLKADLASQPAAPEVARSTKRRPRRRGRQLVYLVAASSPRKRSPTKGRRGRSSMASTTAASSCSSPSRRSRKSRQSCSSWASGSVEEPPPARLTEQQLFKEESTEAEVVDAPAEPRYFGDAPAESLLGSFPLPLGISAWDWPLSRDEKKSLVLMFDRQELMVQRDEFAEQLMKVRGVLAGA